MDKCKKNIIEQLLDKSADFFCFIDEFGKFVWLNNNAKFVFDFHSNNYLEKYFLDQFSDKNRDKLQKFFGQIRSGTSHQLSFQSKHSHFKKQQNLNWFLTWNNQENILYCLATTNERDKSYSIENKQYSLLFNKSPFPKIVYCAETFDLLDVNERAVTTYGYPKKEFLKLNLSDLFQKTEWKKFIVFHNSLIIDNDLKTFETFTHITKDGFKLKIKVEGQKYALGDRERILISCLDVTERYQKDYLEGLEREFMEKALEVEPDWDNLFDFYLKGLENVFPDMKASILKVKDGKVWHIASSLPDSFKTAINGQAISAKAGSCGTAAYLKKRIISSDIANDPLWEDYKFIALPLGLHACWSQPIFNSKKEVIATFANYYQTKREPSIKELEIFERSASLVGIIFENEQKNRELQSKIDQFNYVNLATNEAIYERDFNLGSIIWGQSYNMLFGHEVANKPKPISEWKLLVHPKDLQKTMESLEKFTNNPHQKRWQAKYRFRKADGAYSFVKEKGYAIRNKKGAAIQMIGVLSDISQWRLSNLKKEILTKFNQIFNSNDSLKSPLNQITQVLLEYGGFDISEIWLLNSRKTKLNLYAKSANKDGNKFYEIAKIDSFKKGEGLPGHVWEKKEIVLWDYKDYAETWVRKEASNKANLKNVMAVPLLHRGEFIGVWVCAENQEDSNTFDITQKIGLDLAENLASEIYRKRLEEDLSHIFQLAPDIICALDFEGNFIRMNAAGCELLEYSREEILGIPYTQLEYLANTGILSKNAQQLYKQGKTYRTENRYLTKSGKVLWLDWNCNASMEEGLIYAVAKDFTEKRQILERIKDSFFAVDKNFIVTYWNKAAEEALQTPKDMILGKNLWEVFSDAIDLPSFKYYHKALRTGETVHFEDFYEPVNRWFEISVYPSKTGISVYFKDISQRKQAEEEIQKTNERLKEIAWQQSHFVRAPLARLMAIIELIKYGDLDISEKEDLFNDLTNSADEFDMIIRDISKKTNTIDFNK